MADLVIYPQLSDVDVEKKDFFNRHDAEEALKLLQNNPHEFVTAEITGGASGATTTLFAFVAPVKMRVLKADAIVTTPSAGADNTPTVGIYNGSNAIGVTGAIALSGSAGDVEAMTLDPDHIDLAAGDVIAVKVVTPTATVDTAIKAKAQVIWKPIA